MVDETANIALTKVVPSQTTQTPYYDDFDENKNFHRILYRPGYAVQARELTQSQTIMQNQIERFGSHVFKDGSIVHGGQITISNPVTLNLKPEYDSTEVFARDFYNKIINDGSGNTTIQAHVITGKETVSIGKPVLMISYTSGRPFSNNSTIKVKDENIYAEIEAGENFTTKGTIASIQDSVFYMNGYFIKKPAQTIVVDSFTSRPNVKLGLEFTEEIVTETTDLTLLDPAQEASNYQAPGAGRLKVTLNFTTRPLNTTDEENFIELMRIENGEKVTQTVYPIYSVLGETFARRTYDESGNYTVRPFRTSLEEHATDDTKLTLRIEPGKAYVKGYELETIGTVKIDLPKARDTEDLNNIDVPANYGNDVIVENLSGYPDLSIMPMIDIHYLPKSSINLASNTTYNQSKIGTARIRSFEYYSASNTSNAATHSYDMSLFDVRFNNIVSNVTSSTSNTVTINNSTSVLSNVDDCYAGAYLRFTSGNANGSSYLITNYYSSNNTVLVDSTIAGTILANDEISIEGSFAIAESFVIDSTYTSGATTSMSADISDYNRNSLGYTYLFDTGFKCLIFKIPYKYVKEGSISDQEYQYSRVFNSVSFVAGEAQIFVNPAREQFNSVGASGTSTTVLDNFIVINASSGDIIAVDSVSVNSTTGVATFTYGTFTGTVNIIAKVNLNDGPNVNPKAKVLYTANTTHFTTESLTGTFSDPTGSTVEVYLDGNQAVITNPSLLPKVKESLHVSDVRRIAAIYDLQGGTPTAGVDLTTCPEISNRFIFNNGQTCEIYDYATIELKPKYKAPQGPLVVCFDWYDHIADQGDDLGYFSIDSYPNVNTSDGYSKIPSYISPDGKIFNLRDCIDFRPRKINCQSLDPDYNIDGIRIPTQATNFGCDLSYYLARSDLLSVSYRSNPPFILQQGKSDVRPYYPKSLDSAMPIYKIDLEPYTLSKKSVKLTFIENKRYTMRDIGLLENRIESLEYYTSLTLLEKTATDMLIKDGNGLDRTKNGIIVDNFMTHGIGDVFNPDYFIATDKLYGAASPPQNTIESKLYPAELSGTKVGARLTTLDYEEVPAIVQPYATKYVSVTPYARATFVGTITMDPPADYWVDTSKAPDLIVNNFGENDNLQIGDNDGNGIGGETQQNNINLGNNGLGNGIDPAPPGDPEPNDEVIWNTWGGGLTRWLGSTSR